MKVQPHLIAQQIKKFLADIEANTSKVGVLDDANVVHSVEETLLGFEKFRGVKNITLDPVVE